MSIHGKAVKGKRKILNNANATKALEAVSVLPNKTYVANVTTETYNKKTDIDAIAGCSNHIYNIFTCKDIGEISKNLVFLHIKPYIALKKMI